MVNKRYAISDIHGNYKALKQVLKESKFDYNKDELIIVGDIVDGYDCSYECVEELLKIKNTVFVVGNHDCISEDTEVLSKNGWVKAKNILDEKVANFNIKNGSISYDKPLLKIPIHKDKGIIIEGYSTKQHITSNHQIVVDNKKMKASFLNIDEKINALRFRHFGEINNKGIDIDDDYLKFLIWVVCDGCIYSSSENKKRIQFKLSKKRKLDRLKKLLDNLNIKYTFKKTTKSGLNKLQPFFIRIYGEEARRVFKILEGKKQFPNYFKDMNKSQSKILLEELRITDGHTNKYGKLSIHTINKSDADLIQIIMITNGVSCSIKKILNGSGFKNGKAQYIITIYKKILNKKCVSCKETAIGNFLCFTMPKGTLITRLDGKVAFTGNCWWMNHMATGWAESIWLSQGGEETRESYKSEGYHYGKFPQSHKDFFNKGVYWHETEDMKMLFVHGGFDYPKMPWNTDKETLVWDRELLARAKNGLKIVEWDKVFLGHTANEHGTLIVIDEHPGEGAKVIQLDCGAGYQGRLCLYNIDTDEYFMSDYFEGFEVIK